MKGKAIPFALLQYLQDHTDEYREVTAAEIMKDFSDGGLKISRPTLRQHIAVLREAGYEIQSREVPGTGTFYQYTNREWTVEELQILVDAVASGQFITTGKSNQIICKLQGLAGSTQRGELKPAIAVEERCKAENESIYCVMNAVQQAIRDDAKIRFQYYEYSLDPNLELKRIPKHDGYEYIVSPYATVWKNDRYYLVGYSEKHGIVVQFRIDRMGVPAQVMDKETGKPVHRDPPPEGFILEDRTDKVFAMFDGKKETVKFRCALHLIDQVVDRFGKKLEISERTAETFDVTQEVYVSPTFYAWVFQYVGEMQILEPEWVREEYRKYLQQAMDGMPDEQPDSDIDEKRGSNQHDQ